MIVTFFEPLMASGARSQLAQSRAVVRDLTANLDVTRDDLRRAELTTLVFLRIECKATLDSIPFLFGFVCDYFYILKIYFSNHRY